MRQTKKSLAITLLAVAVVSGLFAEEPTQWLKATWARDNATHAPAPEYPYEARARHIIGSGVFGLIVDWKSGSVLKVKVIHSTGSPILDNAAVSAFGRWKFRRQKWSSAYGVIIPLTYTMSGVTHW